MSATNAAAWDLDRLRRDARLALAYAPKRCRADVAALLILDAQCAQFVGGSMEPVLTQMRLAWWRDRFREPVAKWPKGNPLLEVFSKWGEAARELAPLIDAWEILLGERPLHRKSLAEHAEGRAAGWAALATLDRAAGDRETTQAAGRRWAVADHRWARAVDEESDVATGLYDDLPAPRSRKSLPRSLAVLDLLAQRAMNSGRPPLDRPADLTAALRVGLLGR